MIPHIPAGVTAAAARIVADTKSEMELAINKERGKSI